MSRTSPSFSGRRLALALAASTAMALPLMAKAQAMQEITYLLPAPSTLPAFAHKQQGRACACGGEGRARVLRRVWAGDRARSFGNVCVCGGLGRRHDIPRISKSRCWANALMTSRSLDGRTQGGQGGQGRDGAPAGGRAGPKTHQLTL